MAPSGTQARRASRCTRRSTSGSAAASAGACARPGPSGASGCGGDTRSCTTSTGPRVRLGIAVVRRGAGRDWRSARCPPPPCTARRPAIAGAQCARVWRRRTAAAQRGRGGRDGRCHDAGCLPRRGRGRARHPGRDGAGLRGRHRRHQVAQRRRSPTPGWTVQCALFPGLAALSMVLLARLDQGSAIALLLLVSAYETGRLPVGSGARNPYEGPAAGPGGDRGGHLHRVDAAHLDAQLRRGMALRRAGRRSWPRSGSSSPARCCPPPASPASALRRLDSLLLAAPVWASASAWCSEAFCRLARRRSPSSPSRRGRRRGSRAGALR